MIFIINQVVNTYAGVKVWLRTFLSSVADGGV